MLPRLGSGPARPPGCHNAPVAHASAELPRYFARRVRTLRPDADRVAGPSPRAADRGRRAWRYRLSPFAAGLLLGVACVFGLRTLINHTAVADDIVAPLLNKPKPASADIALVLGAGLLGDCELNGYAVRRVLMAARLWREGRAHRLLFTGGSPVDGSCSVGDAMAKLAGEVGVPADAILVERASHSTYENALKSAPILHGLGAERVLLVTDEMHVRRASAVLAGFGITAVPAPVPVQLGHPNNVSMLLFGLREYAATSMYRANGWMAATPASAAAPPADCGPNGQKGPMNTPATGWRHPSGPIVILGASYAAGLSLQPIAGHAVVNRGMPGQQSTELRERFDRDVVAAQPRAVIIWGYINDIFRAPEGGLPAAVTRAKDNVQAMVAQSRAAGIEPILATELTIRGEDTWGNWVMSWIGWVRGKSSHQETINARVQELNEWLRAYAARECLTVVDLHGILSDPAGVRRREYATPDGSHVPPAGYEALRAFLTPQLTRHFAP